MSVSSADLVGLDLGQLGLHVVQGLLIVLCNAFEHLRFDEIFGVFLGAEHHLHAGQVAPLGQGPQALVQLIRRILNVRFLLRNSRLLGGDFTVLAGNLGVQAAQPLVDVLQLLPGVVHLAFHVFQAGLAVLQIVIGIGQLLFQLIGLFLQLLLLSVQLFLGHGREAGIVCSENARASRTAEHDGEKPPEPGRLAVDAVVMIGFLLRPSNTWSWI